MEMSQEVGELASALAAYQAEAREPGKEGRNLHMRVEYVTLPTVLAVSRRALAKHGLSVSQLIGGGDGAVSVTTMLMHSSGQWIRASATLPPDTHKSRNAVQAMGSSITYLRRYSLLAILGLSDDSDDDGQGSTGDAAAKHEAAADEAIKFARTSAHARKRFELALKEAPSMDDLEAVRRDMSEAKGDMTDSDQRALAAAFKQAVARLASGDGVEFTPEPEP